MRSRAVILPARCCRSMRDGAAAFAQAGLQLVQLFDEEAHVRLARDVHVI